MSLNPRLSVQTTIFTRDTQNAYTTQVTDNTLTQTRNYNGFGEITEIVDNTFTYQLSQRNQNGAITQKKETINGVTETFDYTFDEMGRLTQVQKNNAVSETYTYDNNGNRASATVNNQTIAASYTLDDNLIVYGQNTYGYDEDGYLQTKTTPDGTTTYSYGTMGELLSVATPTKTIIYQHNANNQRVAKLVNNQIVEKYLWANLTTLLAIYDKDDNLVQRFEYADNRMPIAMTDNNGTKYYLHYNQVGTLKAVSRVLSPDNTFEVIKEISYDTYGNVLSDSNPSFNVPFGFSGGLYDTDTKLTRFGYRDYDAYTGKWTAKDPIGFGGGDSNLYGYVLGDPVNFVDPSGLWIPQAIGAGLGLAFEGYAQYQSGNLNLGRLAVAAGTGALGGFGSSLGKAATYGALGNGVNNSYQQLTEGKNCEKEQFDWYEFGTNVAKGAAWGGVGAGIGGLGGLIYRPTPGGVLGSPARSYSPSPNYGTHGTAIGAATGSTGANQ
jgi:RHS repeat-associated protein